MKSKIPNKYKNGHTLEVVDGGKYLGIQIYQ